MEFDYTQPPRGWLVALLDFIRDTDMAYLIAGFIVIALAILALRFLAITTFAFLWDGWRALFYSWPIPVSIISGLLVMAIVYRILF